MKIERTKNASRNIFFGLIMKGYQIIMPFIMRTAMIYLLGVNYLGLNSLFTSVLQVLNLAELGVGSAMVYNMYKPIVDNDTVKICALMRLYRLYYRIIGAVVLAGGVLIIPILPSLIKSDLPADVNLYILYLLNLIATVLTYWLFAYKNSLLQAYQRVDIVSKVTLITDTAKYMLQLASLALFRNYYYYVVIIVLTQVASNIITALVVNKMYPDYKPVGKLPRNEIKAINGKIRDLFTSKLGAVVFESADTIVISAFLGLTMLAIYQNYFYIVSSLTSLIAILFTSCTAGIGNSIIVESEEKNYNDLRKFTLLIAWIAGFCTVCLICLYQTFMEIWVTEKLMLKFGAVICFSVYFFINQFNSLLNLYKDAAGMWHEDRFRPLVVSLANLLVNIILVQFIGIYGVLLASCLTKTLIGIPWILHNLFTVVFKRNPWDYIKKLFYYVFVTGFVSIIAFLLCSLVPGDGILIFFVKAVICCFIGNICFLIFYRKTEEFLDVMKLMQKMLPFAIFRMLTKLTRVNI